MSSVIETFDAVDKDQEFYFDVENRTRRFVRRNGTSFENGPLRPIDYNAVDVDNGEGWQFDGPERVIRL